MPRKVPKWKIEQMRREEQAMEAAQRHGEAPNQPVQPPSEQYPPAYYPPQQQQGSVAPPLAGEGTAPQMKASVPCPSCGSMNTPTASNCWACGYQLIADPAPDPSAAQALPLPGTWAGDGVAAGAPALPAKYAGFWLRLGASIIDSIALTIPLVIVSFGMSFFVFFLADIGGAAGDDEAIYMGANIFSNAIAVVSGWLYYALMESSQYQATLGKMALGIIVTDIKGNRLNFSRATGRYFGKIISALICYVGFVMAGFTEKKQALHDMLASTLVVTKPRY